MDRYNFKTSKLVLSGRGRIDSCYCPSKVVNNGELYDTVTNENDLTDIEVLHIGPTFHISACALLDIMSRSPKLKILRFYGVLSKRSHCDVFATKHFHCSLERLYWPWPTSKHKPVMRLIARRNENINTIYTNTENLGDLLASDVLPNLRFLSLKFVEDWSCEPGNSKKTFKFLDDIKYLSSAKNLEALDLRTYDHLEIECEKTRQEVEQTIENFKLSFWEQVSKLKHLKFLSIHGAWEFESVCRQLDKYALPIEYLQINLFPASLMSSIDSGEDRPTLSMANGLRSLRKLPQLSSIHLICPEKLYNICERTISVFKELNDLIWIIDVKVWLTAEVEDLLNSILRRGLQLGKNYKIKLHVQPKDNKYASILGEFPLKIPHKTDLREKLESHAKDLLYERFKSREYENVHLWGVELVGSTRDNGKFERLSSDWKAYTGRFLSEATRYDD